MNKVICVEGMTCMHCKQRVENALKDIEGVKSVTVSLEEKTVTVEHEDNRVSIDKIKEIIRNQGYDVV